MHLWTNIINRNQPEIKVWRKYRRKFWNDL